MSGTKAGGLLAAQKYLARDPHFYAKIGRIGGCAGKGPDYQKHGDKAAGFAADPNLARIAGAKGGRRSSRKGVSNRFYTSPGAVQA